MPRGRKPNPIETVQSGLLSAPEWMTASQKLEWHYLLSHAPLGLLSTLDKGILVAYVIAADIHRQASEKIASMGVMMMSSVKKVPVQNPYLPVLNKQAQIMMKAASEMGFTPSSRSRITVENQNDNEDSLEALLSGSEKNQRPH
jgi:P27 family predicted phage terminase small subunit